MKNLLRKLLPTCLALAAMVAGASSSAFADIVDLSGNTTASAFHFDYSSFVESVASSQGTYSSSTLTPDQYAYGDQSIIGSSFANLTMSANTVTLFTSETIGSISGDEKIEDRSSATSIFTVTQDTAFALTATLNSTGGYEDFYLYSSSLGYLAIVDSTTPGTHTWYGTLYAGMNYVLQQTSWGIDDYWSNINYIGDASGTAILTINSVPEPSSLGLISLGGIGTVFGAYRRRRSTCR